MKTMTTPKPNRRMSRGRLEDGAPNPIDVHVGTRVRLRRTLLGLSQEKLGEALRLTFQQVQKYERGANRISASRLFDLSRVLNVPVSYFYDDMAEDVAASSPLAVIAGKVPKGAGQVVDTNLSRRETLELVRAYFSITDPDVRHRVFELARALGGGE